MKISVPSRFDSRGLQALRQALNYLGPGFFVTVGFIDPGNWATNIAGGSYFNYSLLWVVVLGAIVLVVWQHMAAHLGIVTGRCLAEAVREYSGRWGAIIYGSTAMAAMVATAVAEILGAALGLQLLFHIPVRLGAALSALVILLVLWFQKYKLLERMIVGFVSLIGICYLVEIYMVRPDWGAVAHYSFVPHVNSQSILIAMGILGAVVMPHNIYLHSEVIQSREWTGKSDAETKYLLRFEFLDTLLAMLVGMLINAAMIIVAAAVFYANGVKVNSLIQASATLRPLVGDLSSLVFGVALLAAGFSSSMTAAMAGGTTLSGYMGKATAIESRWFRAGMLVTLIPACIVVMLVRNSFSALILSQVCLSLQLPLTMLPLFLITNSRRIMGKYVNSVYDNLPMVVTGVAVIVLNVLLLYNLFGGRF